MLEPTPSHDGYYIVISGNISDIVAACTAAMAHNQPGPPMACLHGRVQGHMCAPSIKRGGGWLC